MVNEYGHGQVTRLLNSIEEWTIQVFEDLPIERFHEVFVEGISKGDVSQETTRKLAKKIRATLLNSTPKIVREDVTDALDEGRFSQKFQILHDLKEKYKDRTTNAWRPPYNAVDHMRNARVKAKEYHLKELELLIAIRKSCIAELKDKIRSSSDTCNSIPSLIKEIECTIDSAHRKSANNITKVVSFNDQLNDAVDVFSNTDS